VSTGVARPDLPSTLAAVDSVEGWLSEDQARRLWEAARRVPPGGRIVEIGSFRGRSTIVLRRAADPAVEVVAIDPHGGGDRGPREISPDAARGQADHEAFLENLRRAGAEGGVRHVRRMSRDALGEVEGPVDLLYVDGAHRYGPARADLQGWGERVRPGGAMLLHDAYNAVGVMLAQLRVLVLSRRWRYLGRTRSLAEYRREDVAGRAWVRNAARQLLALPYFLRNGLIKVAVVARLPRVARRLGLPAADDWPY
jgi:predicted O-methyltransferase YrrM